MILHKNDGNLTLRTQQIFASCTHTKIAEHAIRCELDSEKCAFDNIREKGRDCVCCDLYEDKFEGQNVLYIIDSEEPDWLSMAFLFLAALVVIVFPFIGFDKIFN